MAHAFNRTTLMVSFIVAILLVGALVSPPKAEPAPDDGVVRARSAYPFAETVERLKMDVASKGIMMFSEIDQARLAKDAGLSIIPSTLLVFGNPPLGTQFIAAKPEAGLDWPVRLLVQEDTSGQVSVSYTDFAWIARRHGVQGAKPFSVASDVIAAITSSVVKH